MISRSSISLRALNEASRFTLCTYQLVSTCQGAVRYVENARSQRSNSSCEVRDPLTIRCWRQLSDSQGASPLSMCTIFAQTESRTRVGPNFGEHRWLSAAGPREKNATPTR